MENTKLWDKLGKTDPAHTKQFSRSGGFKGTAIKPMFSYKRMTEEFGPCGDGWGINEPSFQVVPASDEILVFCTVSIWHGSKENIVFGVGGDKVLAKFSSGLKTDDEAFKKSFTDAVTNALKMIGVGADVHMGMFDDSKYVNAMESYFTDKPEEKFSQENRSLQNTLITTMAMCKDKIDLSAWLDENQKKIDSLPEEMSSLVNQEYENRLDMFDKGIEPPAPIHKFAGVDDAIAWMNKMAPVVKGFKSLSTIAPMQQVKSYLSKISLAVGKKSKLII